MTIFSCGPVQGVRLRASLALNLGVWFLLCASKPGNWIRSVQSSRARCSVAGGRVVAGCANCLFVGNESTAFGAMGAICISPGMPRGTGANSRSRDESQWL